MLDFTVDLLGSLRATDTQHLAFGFVETIQHPTMQKYVFSELFVSLHDGVYAIVWNVTPIYQ